MTFLVHCESLTIDCSGNYMTKQPHTYYIHIPGSHNAQWHLNQMLLEPERNYLLIFGFDPKTLWKVNRFQLSWYSIFVLCYCSSFLFFVNRFNDNNNNGKNAFRYYRATELYAQNNLLCRLWLHKSFTG